MTLQAKNVGNCIIGVTELNELITFSFREFRQLVHGEY